MKKDYLIVVIVFLWDYALSLKPGSNIYPNEYCLREGQYLPHPHSPCRYLRCGRLPSGLDIDEDLRKVLFSAEYRCPIGYSVRPEVFRKARNGHISDICIAKDPRCLKEDIDVPGATQAPKTANHRDRELPQRQYVQKSMRSKGHGPPIRKYSNEDYSRRVAHQNALVSKGRPSASSEHQTVKFGQGGHRVADNLVIPRQIAQLHPWLVQNESSVPYVAGPPMPMRPPTTALPLTTTEAEEPRYLHQRNHRRPHEGHKYRINSHPSVHPSPLYPPGYKPRQATSDIQSDYSSIIETRTTRQPTTDAVTRSPLNYNSHRFQNKHRKRPVFKYWAEKKLNNPEKYTKNTKQAHDQLHEQSHDVEHTPRESSGSSGTQPIETKPIPSPSNVTPKVSYKHLYNSRNDNMNRQHNREPSASLPGVYTRFKPEPLNFNRLQDPDQHSNDVSQNSKQVNVDDYGSYSDLGAAATPWPQPVGLDDDAINRYLPAEDNQKSTGMYIPEATLATLKLKVTRPKVREVEKGKYDDAEDNKDDDAANKNIDTGEDSPMFPVPVVVRGENKGTGNPLSLSNLPRGYYVLMPLKKTEKIPVLPKVSLTEEQI